MGKHSESLLSLWQESLGNSLHSVKSYVSVLSTYPYARVCKKPMSSCFYVCLPR